MTGSCHRARHIIEQEVSPLPIIDLYVDDAGSVLSHGELVDELVRRLNHMYVYGVPEVGGWEYIQQGGIALLQFLEAERKPHEQTYRVQFPVKNPSRARLSLCFNATPDAAVNIRERMLRQLRLTARRGLKEDRWSDARVRVMPLFDIDIGMAIPGIGRSSVQEILGPLDHQFVQGTPGLDRTWLYIHPFDAELLVALEARRPAGERTYRIAFVTPLHICVCFNATPDEAKVVKERLLRLLRQQAGHRLAESDDTVDGTLLTGQLISTDVEPLLPPGTLSDVLSYYAPDHEHTAVILGLKRRCQDLPERKVYLVVSRNSLMALYAVLTPDEFALLRQRLDKLDRSFARDDLSERVLRSRVSGQS